MDAQTVHCHTASVFCGTTSTPEGHRPAVEAPAPHLPQRAVGGPWECLESADDLECVWKLKASLGEARTASGEEILEGRTLDKGRKEDRQKTEISTSGYTRKGPVDRNVP